MLGVPVSEMEAKQYDSIEQFIAGNFTKGPQSLFAKDDENLQVNGVLWKAKFNEMNETYLSKPSKDLRTFCSANGGDIHNVPQFDMEKILVINA